MDPILRRSSFYYVTTILTYIGLLGRFMVTPAGISPRRSDGHDGDLEDALWHRGRGRPVGAAPMDRGLLAATVEEPEAAPRGRYSGSQLRTSCATCVAAGGSRLARTMTT